VDDTGRIVSVEDKNGSWLITIAFSEEHAGLLVSKGSICIDGISLTVVDPTLSTFQVAIIPYTYAHTNLHIKGIGDTVNLEFDIFGKYVTRYLSLRG